MESVILYWKTGKTAQKTSGKDIIMKKLEDYIRTIPDYPEEGIMFRDITTLIGNGEGFHRTIDEMAERLKGLDFDVIAGAESRGFIFGTPLAYLLNKPFVPVRKKRQAAGGDHYPEL